MSKANITTEQAISLGTTVKELEDAISTAYMASNELIIAFKNIGVSSETIKAVSRIIDILSEEQEIIELLKNK